MFPHDCIIINKEVKGNNYMDKLPDYQHINDLLLDSHIFIEPAQAHGLLCGLLVCNPNTRVENWVMLVSDDEKLWNKLPSTAQEEFAKLCDVSQKELRDPDFRFELLLPSDDEMIAERAHAIGLWCKGFVMGVEEYGNYLGGLLGKAQEDVEEALSDLQAIAEVEHQVKAHEEQEKALTSVIEYVRIAVLLVQRELSENFAQQELQGKTIH
jgi:uncharacterized protein YgfB (UPF0149 family)